MKHPVRFLLGCTLVGGAALVGATLYRKPPPPAPFSFPTAELAAIDRDLQVRFAVVPEKDFGIERAYGNQHYLYDPQTPTELANVAALKRNDTEAAFYLMSRALWLRSWDGALYKPIQGPVFLTGKIETPLPRKINFMPDDNQSQVPVMDQDNSSGADGAETLTSHNPDGTPVPELTARKGAPKYNRLQELGNRVFEMAEAAPKTAKIGIAEPINAQWNIVAVPIRASDKACLPCHIYRPLGKNPNATKRLTVDVGDALGVAFYLYNVKDSEKISAKAQTQNAVN